MERIRLRNILRPGMLLIGLALIGLAVSAQGATKAGDVASQDVKKSISANGRARVVVKLRMAEPLVADQRSSADRERKRRLDITAGQQRIRDQLRGTNYSVRREFRSLPYVAVEIDAAGLARLQKATGDVAQIVADPVFAPSLADSIPQIEADIAHARGYNGSGSTIAIVDTGVDNSHPFLAGKVIDEACIADREVPGDPGSCPNGANEQYGAGAGSPCLFAPNSCQHGTHVAGIAAGSGDFPGVAPSANLLVLQIFHRSIQCSVLEEVPCARAFGSDITAALEYVYERRGLHDIASVNMSLGGSLASGPCDADLPEMAEAINNLKTARIATVVASGNSSARASISWPACISAAIAVGAVDDDDNVASFSNVSKDLDLFAPGVGIRSSVPGGGFASLSGTSMAAPHVAGAWAVMRQANPLASVDDVLTSLVNTGRPTPDGRSGGTFTKPRIRLGAALGIEAPMPVLLAISPSSLLAWSPGGAIKVFGTNFVRASVVYLNGVPGPTTYLSSTELEVEVTSADLMTQATSIAVSVATPPPGGGSSATLPLLLTQPSLSVDTALANAGAPVTVTLTNGTGSDSAWIALARVGDLDVTYQSWTYVGTGNSTFVWTVNMPSTAGNYEFRLFSGGYMRIATSPTISVTSPAPPPPPPPPPAPNPPVLTVDATVATIGAPVTVMLSNGSGVWNDWIALARVGDPDNAYLTWTYVGTGNSSFVWTANMPSTAGEYEFRLFANGGYTRTATSPTITVTSAVPPPPPPPPPAPNPPVLAVNATAANTGAPVTVTLTNGTGSDSAWIALARVGDLDVTYQSWTYVGTGNSTFVWTVNMPSTAGNYEFRLFSGGYMRIATSPTISVTSPAPPPPPPPPPAPNPPVLTVDATVATIGAPVTVMLSNGSGVWNDWIALARVGDPDNAYLTWTYVGTGNSSFVWTANMPSTAGEYEFRLFANGGYTRTATSAKISVTLTPPAPNPPALAVNTTLASIGAPVTVTLTNGSGVWNDWIALARVGDPDNAYSTWTYVGTGNSTFVWTVNMPSTAGNYEFRLFGNGGYARSATSPMIQVVP